ncbi:hypothetical protein IG631_11185 [Alternaria alternata]|jgi:hypothetical protein|nr:hypothetical protein IG631_11185 [Alternaria alternata]
MFPRHVSKTLACATWAGSVAWSETAKLFGAAEPEGMSNLPQAEARWWVVGLFGVARQLQDGRRRFESWRRTSQFVLSCKSLLATYTAVRMEYIASARHGSSAMYPRTEKAPSFVICLSLLATRQVHFRCSRGSPMINTCSRAFALGCWLGASQDLVH